MVHDGDNVLIKAVAGLGGSALMAEIFLECLG